MKQARDADAAVGQLPASWPRGREAERQVWGEVLAALEAQHRTMTAFMERYQGIALNNTLEVCTAAFDASGLITRSFHAAVGSVQVVNLSLTALHNITVVSGGPTGQVPATGRGVAVVLPGTSLTVGLAATSFTLYGTAADLVTFQAFTTGANSPRGVL